MKCIFFYLISELILATLIQRYDNKIDFISRTRDELKFYRLSGAIISDCINTTYQFIKPLLDNKLSIFEDYGDFKLLMLSITRSGTKYINDKTETNIR